MKEEKARRNTRQRKLILKAVEELGCHPTAEQVFDHVREELPRTSLSTVYRNLGILVDQGRIKAVPGSGKEVHYDHNKYEHCHIECCRCGKMCDVDVTPIDSGELTPDELSGYTLLEVNINLLGICPECSEKEKE
ncbi:MAG: transcriptional repressor [Candidatus Aegiribacteria sp.]